MLKKHLTFTLITLLAGSMTAQAQFETGRLLVPDRVVVEEMPQRTTRTIENRFPAYRQFEAGVSYNFREFEDKDEGILTGDINRSEVIPYLRYGLWENTTVLVEVPWVQNDPDVGEKEDGQGDVVVGLQLKAFEDIFDYPYIIPHVDVTFDTGDEDKGLGAGESVFTFGISVGTVVQEVLHWIGDVSYEVRGDNENIVIAAVSIIWDMSNRFAWILEGDVRSEDVGTNDNHPYFFQGGFNYEWTDSLQLTLYGGGGKEGKEDVLVGGKLGYTF